MLRADTFREPFPVPCTHHPAARWDGTFRCPTCRALILAPGRATVVCEARAKPGAPTCGATCDARHKVCSTCLQHLEAHVPFRPFD